MRCCDGEKSWGGRNERSTSRFDDSCMNGAWRWIRWRKKRVARRGASIGSLDGGCARCTRVHTRTARAGSRREAADDLGPCTLLVTHGTLCSGEPLITDAESISISRGFTTCDLDRAPHYPPTGCAARDSTRIRAESSFRYWIRVYEDETFETFFDFGLQDLEIYVNWVESR